MFLGRYTPWFFATDFTDWNGFIHLLFLSFDVELS